jgi:hypothetical protein
MANDPHTSTQQQFPYTHNQKWTTNCRPKTTNIKNGPVSHITVPKLEKSPTSSNTQTPG